MSHSKNRSLSSSFHENIREHILIYFLALGLDGLIENTQEAMIYIIGGFNSLLHDSGTLLVSPN